MKNLESYLVDFRSGSKKVIIFDDAILPFFFPVTTISTKLRKDAYSLCCAYLGSKRPKEKMILVDSMFYKSCYFKEVLTKDYVTSPSAKADGF